MSEQTEMSHRIRVHCFSPYREILGTIPGIAQYPDRSVLLYKGTSYLDGSSYSDVAEDHLKTYLHSFGIGASEIRFVTGDTLFEGILSDPVESERLRLQLTNGHPTTLEAFSACDEFDRFVASLNIDPLRLRTPMTSVMRMLDDKEAIRRLARTLELNDVFPEHVFASDRHEVIAHIREFRERYPELVVVKRPDLESGVGQLLIKPDTSEDEIFAYVREYCTGHRPIIIEQGVFGVEGSVQWHVSPEGIEPRFFSRQYTHAGAHQGNVIAFDGESCLSNEWPFMKRKQIVRRIWSATETFVKWIAQRGFIGPIGFDFIVNPNAFYILECNARTTAATYLESVRWQVGQQNPGRTICAAMKNAYPKHGKDWKEAVSRLYHNVGYNPRLGTGVIVANPRLFHLDTPKCLLIAIGDSVEFAEHQLETARQIL